LQILTEADEVQGLREDKPKKDKKKEETKEGEEKEKKVDENGEPMETEGDETAVKAEGEGEKKEEEETEEPEVPEQPEVEPILDFVEGEEIGTDIESKIPKYNMHRAVGSSMINKLTCFECRLCTKYFDTEKTAEIHSRTFNHHRLFVKFLNEKANEIKIAMKRAAAAQLEETERLKRQKLESETENGTEEQSKPDEAELYDPSNATGDEDIKEEANGNDDNMEPKIVEEPVSNGEEKPAEVATPVEETPAAVEETPAPVEAPKVEEPAKPQAQPPSQPQTPVQNQNQNQNMNQNQNQNFNQNMNRGNQNRNQNQNRGRRTGRYSGRY
jgi:hypothetical protein